MDRREALTAAEERLRVEGMDVQCDPHVAETARGSFVVHAQQQYRGLSVYPHSITVKVREAGDITIAGDRLLDLDGFDVVPTLRVEDAVRAAYRHLIGGVGETCHTAHEPLFTKTRYRPRIAAAFPMVNRPTVLNKGPFDEPVQANLVISSGTRALAWLVSLVVKGTADFTVIIKASGEDAGRVLYCAAEAASARARVYRFNPDESALASVEFPLPLNDYPPPLVAGGSSFRSWLTRDQTIGNNVEMFFQNSPKDGLVRAVKQPDASLVFTTNVGSKEEMIVNAFFLCNFLHDFFSLIGFGEADGNFQQQNFGTDGKGGDRLVVNVLTSAHGNANMRAQNDGTPAEMTLGVWRNSMPPLAGKPTALDADVVIHEFAHGVSQRLVGGRLKKTALVEKQSLALGEAWSDYFAITIQNHYRVQPRFTFAKYASQLANGVRPQPYNQFTANFGQLGTPPFDEQHGAGSVFAAALIRMHDRLRDLLGPVDGEVLSWRLVVASLKTLTANPTFIEARDAIRACVPDFAPANAAAVETRIWQSFAPFGLGRNASCSDTSFQNITADFTT